MPAKSQLQLLNLIKIFTIDTELMAAQGTTFLSTGKNFQKSNKNRKKRKKQNKTIKPISFEAQARSHEKQLEFLRK